MPVGWIKAQPYGGGSSPSPSCDRQTHWVDIKPNRVEVGGLLPVAKEVTHIKRDLSKYDSTAYCRCPKMTGISIV